MGRGEQPAVVWQWLRGMAHLSIVVVFVLTAVGYAPVREPAARPGKAGQPLNPVATAAHIAAGDRENLPVSPSYREILRRSPDFSR